MAFTAEQETRIQEIMTDRKLNRKSAVQFFRRQQGETKARVTTGKQAPAPVPESVQQAAQAHEQAEQAIGDVQPETATPAPEAVAAANVPALANANGPYVGETAPPAPQAATTAPVDAPAGETPKQPGRKGRKGKVEAFDSAKAVELYLAGTKVVDIAVALGYKRGTGQNRVRIALMAAGVYKDTPKK